MPPDTDPIAVGRAVGRARFAFTSRHGGASVEPYASLNLGLHVGDHADVVTANRARALRALGIEGRVLCEAEQVHGAKVETIAPREMEERRSGRVVAPGADALVMAEPCAAALALFYADCVPVFIAHPSGPIALAHAGWRGTARGVAEETVARMVELSRCAPGDLHAVIGPCVGICCYEVGEDVAGVVLATVPGPDREALGRRDGESGKWTVDLAGINARQLRNAGLPEGHVEVIRRCTCCEKETFFSVRGDGRTTGRCAAIAWMD